MKKLGLIVVGGGVFGVTAALELRRRGHRVALVEAGRIPREEAASTDISKAIRMDYGSDEFYTRLMERAFDGWDAWNVEWDRPAFHPSGFLLLSRGPMRPGGFEHDSYHLLRRRGHAVERVDRETLARRFPRWNAAGYSDGYFNPRAGWAESGVVVRRLAARARDAGVTLHEDTPVRGLIEDRSAVRGIVAEDGQELTADRVLLATGAWTSRLLPELRDELLPVAQPVLYFRPERPAEFAPPHFTTWAADISNSGWYGFPITEDGTLKIANHGPGRGVAPDAPRITEPADEERFRAFVAESLPALAGAPLGGSRLCLYCDTRDGDFWIDHHPQRENLFVATGGSGHGFKFAPVLGGIIADRLEGKPNPFAERFAWRKPRGRTGEAARHL